MVFFMLKVVMARGRKLKKGGLVVRKQNVLSLDSTIEEENVASLYLAIVEQIVVWSDQVIVKQIVVSSY